MLAVILFTLLAIEPSGNSFALDTNLTQEDCEKRKAQYLYLNAELECIPEGWEEQNWMEGGK